MSRFLFIALLFLSAYGYAQIPMVGSGRTVYSPDQVDSLFYWFDAQDAGSITTTNNKVTQWNDKSGNDYHVTQADTSKAPTYSATSGPGGSTAALTFDGTDDFLASAAHFWGSDDITFFLVHKVANPTRNTFELIIARTNTGSNLRQFIIYESNTADAYAFRYLQSSNGLSYGGGGYRDGAKSTSYKITSSQYNGSGTAAHYINGAAQTLTIDGTLTTSFNATQPTYIGAELGTVYFLQGSISEIIVFSRALTNAERQGIEAYLSSKYNIALQNKQKPKVIIQN